VKLRYEGDENDMIRASMGKHQPIGRGSVVPPGGAGIKTVMKMGNVDLTTIASKGKVHRDGSIHAAAQQACRSGPRLHHRTYFLIANEPLKITAGSTTGQG
jgi:hypothetical protein